MENEINEKRVKHVQKIYEIDVSQSRYVEMGKWMNERIVGIVQKI
jgi:hypothetical protein